ncbi:MAG: 4Fe-4S binding protein [Clostridiales bacterium]|nr:4Fe-4S binding protein [Clostridiales bacterium]
MNDHNAHYDNKVIFDLDTALCCACSACSVACMDQNDVTEGQQPFRSAFEYEEMSPAGKFQCGYFSAACFHCDDASCVIACPAGCLYKDSKTHLTLYDNDCCIGCRSCAAACPFGIPSYDREGKIIKCDGCVERIRRGMEPACVRVCPTGALTCRSRAEIAEKRMT